MEPKDKFSLEQILTSCDLLLEAADKWIKKPEDMETNWILQDACTFRIVQIGEYINRLSVDFLNSHPEIDWRNAVGMRNILTHNYGRVNPEILWETIKENIPPLRDFCQAVLKEAKS
ncbi:DUF86 domain-containing protein [Candidatus Saccharibacteria bacterium]|nr:DUF86 domain-containing protein [Candidatus Saccharibacteria bacterium]